jgi:hypothetical protein
MSLPRDDRSTSLGNFFRIFLARPLTTFGLSTGDAFFVQCRTLNGPPLPTGVLEHPVVGMAAHSPPESSALKPSGSRQAGTHERGITRAVRGSGWIRPVSPFLCQHPHGLSDGQAKAATGSRKLPRRFPLGGPSVFRLSRCASAPAFGGFVRCAIRPRWAWPETKKETKYV